MDIAGCCTLEIESNHHDDHQWRIHNRLNRISILSFRRHHKLSNRLTSHPKMTALYLYELLCRLSDIELLIWLTISFIANVCMNQITGSSKRTYSTNTGSYFCLFSISTGCTAIRIWSPCRVYWNVFYIWITIDAILLVFYYLVVFRYNSEMIIRRLLLWIEYMHVDWMYLFDRSSQLYTDQFQYQHSSQSRTVRNFSEHCWLKFPWYRPEFRYKST